MQEERNSGSGFQSRGSYYQRIYFNTSIHRVAIRSNSPTLDHRISLIDAMDIEPLERKSDFYENILGDKHRHSNYNKRQSSISKGQRSFKIERYSGNQKNSRKSGIQAQHAIDEESLLIHSNNQQNSTHNGQYSNKHIHECNCDKQCNYQHCNCFLYPNQLCLIGLCCSSCIKKKNQAFNKQSESSSGPGCFCKNIKCLKLYCSCYRNGNKCNSAVCKCEGCQNNSSDHIDRKNKKQQILKFRKQHHERSNYHLNKQSKNKVHTELYDFANCSCKKSHCLKRYCSCFFNNKPCNETCACQDCYNNAQYHESSEEMERKARYARHDVENQQGMEEHNNNEIDQFFQPQISYQGEQMNQNMEFQPVNFQHAGR